MRTMHRVAQLLAVGLLGLCVLGAPGAWADDSGTKMDPKMTPATGEPPGAATGCCCLPKLEVGSFTCVGNTTEFDCKAQCAELKDGRKPSDCTWKAGSCPK
ncbi:MAG: hypothetical protein SF182_25650 [Deltaproteobacteria bacterium]|nr:hypothetical protein [Deltaproteobacteria bacterium]